MITTIQSKNLNNARQKAPACRDRAEGEGKTVSGKPESKERRALTQIRAVFDALQVAKPTMGLQMAQVFIAVALNPGIDQTTLSELAGIKQNTISRNVNDLGKKMRNGKPGLDLVEVYLDSDELRRRFYRLSPRGEELLKNILAAVEQ